MLRPRSDGLSRLSSLFIQAHPADVSLARLTDTAAAALPHMRHKVSAPLLSPYDRVRAHVRGEQDDEVVQPGGYPTSDQRGSHVLQDSVDTAGVEPEGALPDLSRLQPTSATSAPSPSSQHWLDRHFPNLRKRLQRSNTRWWLRGVQARCRQFPQLSGREELIVKLVTEKYQEIVNRHRHRVIDGRSETHLQVAALLLATYQTLSPWLRDEQELTQLLKEHMGGQASPGLRVMLRGTLLLSRSPFAWQSARLRALQLDQGAGFKSQLQRDDADASLTVGSCFYHDLLSAEGVPHLAAACCCSVDRVWFEDLEWHGVAFEQPSCLARGDSCCQLRVRKI